LYIVYFIFELNGLLREVEEIGRVFVILDRTDIEWPCVECDEIEQYYERVLWG